jgi:hypothetical protein
MKLILKIHMLTHLFVNEAIPKGNITHEESQVYDVVNSFIESEDIKRVRLLPLRYIYSNSSCEGYDTCDLGRIDWFFERVMETASELDFNLTQEDIVFMADQIRRPAIKMYSQKGIKKAKVRKKQSWIFITNPISLPLFTVDHQHAVLSCNYYGMSRTFLFHFNKVTHEWKKTSVLWQSGS